MTKKAKAKAIGLPVVTKKEYTTIIVMDELYVAHNNCVLKPVLATAPHCFKPIIPLTILQKVARW